MEQNNEKKTKMLKIRADLNYLPSHGYKVTKQIGRGGYGVVYKAKSSSHLEQQFAIKINFNTVSREIIYAEMAFLLLVNGSRNLPILRDIFMQRQITHIVLEYFKFRPFITFFNQFTIEQAKHYILQLLIGLKCLKNLGIYHRDIKPSNFLYNPQTRRGIIIDFGLAQLDRKFVINFQQKYNKNQLKQNEVKKLTIYKRLTECLQKVGRNKIGTETYMPIQSILHHVSQSYTSDIWPVGVILLQFVTRKYNFFNNVRMVNRPNNIKNPYYINYIVELANIFGPQEVIRQCKRLGYQLQLPKDIQKFDLKAIAIIEGYDEIIHDLILRLLDLNAETRISVEEAISNPFFDSVRDAHIY